MLVNVIQLYKQYRIGKKDIPVLKGIDFSVEEGEIVAVMGKSGAGKSTLLNLIGTLDKPDSGIIKFNGENILDFDDKKLADFRNKYLGFVFQFHYLLPEFTAIENIMLPGLIKGDEKKAREVYQGMTPLKAGDIAEAIYFMASRPPHVVIADLTIFPLDQASAQVVRRHK